MSTEPHVQNVLNRLEKVKEYGAGWVALCPAHQDKRPSLLLHINQENGGLMLKCLAGCSYDAIVSALDLQRRDFYPPRETHASARHKDVLEATFRYTNAS